MQKPVKRGNSWRIIVQYNKQRYTATRDTAKECEQWASRKILELKAHSPEELEQINNSLTFIDLFDLYYDKEGKFKRGVKFIKQQRKAFKKYWGDLADTLIHQITPHDIIKWRDKRLKKVTAGTVHRQMSLYSSIFTFACFELLILKANPFAGIKRPTKPKPRHRLISKDEIDLILDGLGYQSNQIPTEPRHYVAWSFLFALETAMRKGEILNIQHENIHDDYIHLPMTKNGTARDVPLSSRAKALLQLMPKKDTGQLVPHNSNSFRLIWQRNLHRVGLNGSLTFHDTRHEAITRFVNQQKLPVEILAKVTGHKDIKTLINVYYNPKATDIARMLG